jgi:hypothetical protein
MRVAIFVAIVAAHVLLFLFFPPMRRMLLRAGEDQPTAILVFFPPAPMPSLGRPEASRKPMTPSQSGKASNISTKTSAEPLKSHPEPPATEPEPISPPAVTDWAKEAELGAGHAVDGQIDAERKAAALSSRYHVLPGPRERQPEFHWDYAHTHRIEPLPGGGLIIAINDNCAVVVYVFPMPFCKLGKIKPRGDLFNHLEDAPKYGDWKDKAP